jgi:hypothetical protein
MAGLIGLLATDAIAVHAQVRSIVPSFGTSIVYDDNVFQRPAAESDLSVRFSPRLDAVRQTDRLLLSGGLALDADRFADHPELTTPWARGAAAFDLRYAASRRWSLAGAAAATVTETPADLNELTALTPGRARARRLLLHPSATYDLGARTDAALGYAVTADTLQGGVSVTTQTASASIDRRWQARDAVRLEYLEQHFLFGGSQASASRAVTAEWTRQVDRGTTLTLRAGPRLTAGVLAPELTASLQRALRTGNLSLSYQQTQTTLIGLDGIARTQSVTAGAGRDVGPRVRLRATAALVETREADLQSRAYRISGGCDWKFAPRLALEAAYDTYLQHGELYASQAAQVIHRNLVTLTLVVADSAHVMSAR